MEKEISDNKILIENSLFENQFSTLEEIQQILAQEINAQETRNQIQQFRIQFEIVKNDILNLETKLKIFHLMKNSLQKPKINSKLLKMI
ncbi:hypothetical protein [Chryseobacterium indoltheticum]|uniref:hypothetical protein n=1 Tax=Chryseobacterium indoltheticum TaxID=254 RepID=UPI003F4927F3